MHTEVRLLVLSLDIDFFVSPVANDVSLDATERLSEVRYQCAPREELEEFLETRCGLSQEDPVLGAVIENHDLAWDILTELRTDHAVVDLIHVDAHADLGQGDPGWVYLLDTWLNRREEAPRRGTWDTMNLANWLAFAGAAGLVNSVEFVPSVWPPAGLFGYYLEPQPPADVESLVFRDTGGQLEKVSHTLRMEWLDQRPVVERVPWKSVERNSFQVEGTVDYMIICRSPTFTPPSADQLVDWARSYIREP